ncbi:Glutamate-cysteine ligase family 2(GCS2) [Legionella massiliensis]|uniref:Glutamate-cysteine ligase family 2(GCS2) n=1 Tax=Legionella massiliensis TaxID=1034943 RepID=A0A078L100_9GAMM|nr:hypothetical protein [Legionella massiliensis]CDZ77719.1 Glutamate-cysteine ligase family 2(GCS2) [Legionella massiliensis]CEE13457.1 Carboxylate-amine ligase YbdK [Legionella massiliensis]
MISYKEVNDWPTAIDYSDFDKRLLIETALLENWFIDKIFIERGLEIGAEIEFFLLDNNYAPSPNNLKFIELVAEPHLVCEVGSAQLEINTEHFNFTANCLTGLHQNILEYWKKCHDLARKNNYHLALIGSLPTATEIHHQLNFMTDKKRYHLINSCMSEQRGGKPISINIEGVENLRLEPGSLAMNGLISALQPHMQIGLSQSVRYYNVAQAIAAPVLAIASNSPFLLGKHVWSDTRIASFDQVKTLQHFDKARGFKSCLFGLNYLNDSFFELFEQNYQFFPRLLPEVVPNIPPEFMFHVRRQNGVVYRWNRPIIDFNEQNQPYLRIEHRGPSTGPTVIDMVANAAFFYGLLNYYAVQSTPINYLLPFHFARKNFFNAARYGLDAQLKWFLGGDVSACELIKNLIPLARKGLQIFDIQAADINFYLDLIDRRVNNKMNGSIWQCKFIKKYGNDFYNMMAAYLENQYQEIPVSEWKI